MTAVGCKSVPPTNAAAIKAEPNMLFWGDTHVHSSHSTGAVDPNQAYRWAQGLAVFDPVAATEVKLEAPLDFLVVTDDAKRLTEATWENIVDAAEKHNEPCHFTSFIGWEWGMPSGDDPRVHRVVLIKQGSERAREIQPATSRVDGNPESLWAWLGAAHSRFGIDFMVIPRTAGLVDPQAVAMDEEEAQARVRWEPVASLERVADSDAQSGSSHEELAREVLLRGLQIDQAIGVNPFKFGVVGAARPNGGDLAAPGLTGVYAEENTRQAIFAAMERKEVFATTGPRIRVRLFGGWNFEGKQANETNMVMMGYRLGHPMGSDLRGRPKAKGPSFVMYAIADPSARNLDRMQIVKGWVDANGRTHSEVYDAVWSGERQRAEDGTVPPVEGEGAPSLLGFWSDSNFDATRRAFYYLRVLQVPTPLIPGTASTPTAESSTLQERAYTSPIWYTPPKTTE